MSDSGHFSNDAQGAPPIGSDRWHGQSGPFNDVPLQPNDDAASEVFGPTDAETYPHPDAASEPEDEIESELASNEGAYAALTIGRTPTPSPDHEAPSDIIESVDQPTAEADYAPITTYTPPAPPPEARVSGVELRRRLRENFVQADNDDAPVAAKQGGLFKRLFARR